jgi:hypothetical protein
MLDVMDKGFLYVSNYRREGVRFEDNTEDEILEATKELNAKIDGVWVESDEERKLNDKYWKIMNMWRKDHKSLQIHPDRDYTMWSVKISYSFLKENQYLLDVDLVGE